MNTVMGPLRLLAFVEGTSLITLLFIAMPLKYHYGLPAAVSLVGWLHGILFLAFLGYATFVSRKKAWSDRFTFLVVLSSMVPFGMIPMDRKLKSLGKTVG